MADFVISLDFELMWGMRDHSSIQSYGRHVLGVREAVPAMLTLFRRFQARATWAAVGLVLFDNKKDMLASLPCELPTYADRRLSPFESGYLDTVGADEKRDPYHFGLSLARRIAETEGMELASHTFSHYYCLEPGQTEAQFSADLQASIDATRRIVPRPRSLVFPRNQFNQAYLATCSKLGFKAYRDNETSWMYRATSQRTRLQRAGRLLDAYANLSGDNGFVPVRDPVTDLVNVPASRFLRPFSRRLGLLEPVRVARIKGAMTSAAKGGRSFHLWWHPHNFGTNLEQNLSVLEAILRHHADLREQYGVRPRTMLEVALDTVQAAREPGEQGSANIG